MKRKIIFLMLLIFCLSVSAVSAADNITDDVSYDFEIAADNFTTHYNSKDQLKFEVTPSLDDNVSFEIVDDASGKVIGNANYKDGQAKSYIKTTAGKHNLTIKIINSTHKVKPLTISAVITKAPVKLTLNKWISTTKDTATLKATVKYGYT